MRSRNFVVTRRHRTQSAVDAALGSLGLLLIALLGWASDRESMKVGMPVGYLPRFLGPIVILGVTAIGYVMDWQFNQSKRRGVQPRLQPERTEDQHV